jgi:hypothetical protein
VKDIRRARREVKDSYQGIASVAELVRATATAKQTAEKLGFWVAQRFQRCDKAFLFCEGFSP